MTEAEIVKHGVYENDRGQQRFVLSFGNRQDGKTVVYISIRGKNTRLRKPYERYNKFARDCKLSHFAGWALRRVE